MHAPQNNRHLKEYVWMACNFEHLACVRSVAGFAAAWGVAFVMLATLPIMGIAGFMAARIVQKNGQSLAEAYTGGPYLTYIHCPGRC
jgi:hypothetical protein